MKKPKVEVQQEDEKPVAKMVLAANIVEINGAMQKLLRSGLNRRAIVALVHDNTKIAKSTIETVIDGIEDLKRAYTHY